MKRDYTAKLGGQKIKLAVTFEALENLVEIGFDPLEVARHAVLESRAIARGESYDLPFSFTPANIVAILKAGAPDDVDIEGAVIEAGLFEAKSASQEYLAAFCMPMSEEDPLPAKKDKSEKK